MENNTVNGTLFVFQLFPPQKPSVKQAVSAKVIEGHVIPNQVIFLRSSEPAKELQTVAFGTDLKVLISIEGRTTDGQQKCELHHACDLYFFPRSRIFPAQSL